MRILYDPEADALVIKAGEGRRAPVVLVPPRQEPHPRPHLLQDHRPGPTLPGEEGSSPRPRHAGGRAAGEAGALAGVLPGAGVAERHLVWGSRSPTHRKRTGPRSREHEAEAFDSPKTSQLETARKERRKPVETYNLLHSQRSLWLLRLRGSPGASHYSSSC
jgi:hypothetical protein